MKIYTKTGDFGETSLIGGKRVSKNHPRIEAYGTLDELNSYIGLIKDLCETEAIKDILLKIQNQLFVAESILASENPEQHNIPQIKQDDILFLEKQIDLISQELKPLQAFLLPGGHPLISHSHIARCICRRAERLSILACNEFNIDKNPVVYLNRLSDFLFVLARKFSKDLNINEVLWQPNK